MAKGDKDNRRCSYKDCKKPEGCRQYFQIEAGRSSGGQNWNALAGFTLCPTCYQQYKSRGTLERKKPLSESAKKCSYELCDGSNQGKQFYEISENSNAGGKNWKPLKGRVLCHTCYCRYKSRGTLERSLSKPLSAEQKRCTYEHCARPDQSCQFLQIDGNKKTGGQDWSSLAGAVLCNSCYSCFKSRGTLERRSQSTNDGMSSFLKPESAASRAQAAPKPPAAVASKAVKRTAATAAEDGAGLLLKMAGVETAEGATADMGGAGGKGKRKKIASAKAKKEEEEEAPGAASNAKRASGAFA